MYSRTSDFLTSFSHTPNHHSGSINLWHMPTAPLQAIGSNPTTVAFISGATAGVSATMATYPFDICRTAFASSKGSHILSSTASATKSAISSSSQSILKSPTSIGQFFSTIYKVHGIKGLYAGAFPACLQIVPYMGINFALYDYFCRVSDRTNAGNAALAGAFAGGISKFIVYPMDTVKKRMQASTFITTGNIMDEKIYKNMLDCTVRMAKEEVLHAWLDLTKQVVQNYFLMTGRPVSADKLFQSAFPEELWNTLRRFVINLSKLPLWVDRPMAATVFGGKQSPSVWATIFQTGKSPQGQQVLSAPINIIEMVK
jgi:hypothetical protein